MATVYFVNGMISEIPSKKVSMEKLQQYVEGWVEIVPLTKDKYLAVNEEGLLMDLPFNKSAMFHIPQHYGVKTPMLVGNVVVISKSELE